MYDTVRAFLAHAVTEARLQSIGAQSEQRVDYSTGQVFTRWFLNDGDFRLTYHPNDGLRGPMLLFEVSLPKLVHGENVTMLHDPGPALDAWTSVIGGRLPGLPHMSEWGASRVDFCWNFRLRSEAVCRSYINSLARLRIARHKPPVMWFGETVEWVSKSHLHGHYCKGAESHQAAAERVYRCETRLTVSRSVQSYLKLGKGATVGQALTPVHSRAVLNADLRRLGVGMGRITSDDVLFSRLVEVFGIQDAASLYGFVQALVKVGGRDNLIRAGYARRTYYNHLKRLKDAGFVPALLELGEDVVITAEGQELPPLLVPELEDIAKLVGDDGSISPERFPEV